MSIFDLRQCEALTDLRSQKLERRGHVAEGVQVFHALRDENAPHEEGIQQTCQIFIAWRAVRRQLLEEIAAFPHAQLSFKLPWQLSFAGQDSSQIQLKVPLGQRQAATIGQLASLLAFLNSKLQVQALFGVR